MMDYYEELGVSPAATIEEIRKAYKQLVRLLHPDRCQEEPARRLAEIQTQRLNGILTILLNPESRDQYDRSLMGTRRQRGIPWPPRRRHAPGWFWPALGILVLVNLVILFDPDRAGPMPQAAKKSEPASPPPAVPGQQVRNHRTGDRQALLRQGLPSAPENAPGALPPALGGALPDLPTLREFPPQTEGPVLPVLLPHPQFSGNWLFRSSSRRETKGLYSPEYIELRLTQGAGSLRGRYRARYRVPDRAISPAVAFEFDGPCRGAEAALPWTGSGGASGEVTLRLIDGDTLEVSWVANRIGSELGLVSGKAILIRRQD